MPAADKPILEMREYKVREGPANFDYLKQPIQIQRFYHVNRKPENVEDMKSVEESQLVKQSKFDEKFQVEGKVDILREDKQEERKFTNGGFKFKHGIDLDTYPVKEEEKKAQTVQVVPQEEQKLIFQPSEQILTEEEDLNQKREILKQNLKEKQNEYKLKAEIRIKELREKMEKSVKKLAQPESNWSDEEDRPN